MLFFSFVGVDGFDRAKTDTPYTKNVKKGNKGYE
jgi:hypothetical protein